MAFLIILSCFPPHQFISRAMTCFILSSLPIQILSIGRKEDRSNTGGEGSSKSAIFVENVVSDFIVKNEGYGSTVYTVSPECCSPTNIIAPLIRYSEDTEYRVIRGPDFRSIGPKSADLVEIIYPNVSLDEMPSIIPVKIVDYGSGKRLFMFFNKSPKSYFEMYARK